MVGLGLLSAIETHTDPFVRGNASFWYNERGDENDTS